MHATRARSVVILVPSLARLPAAIVSCNTKESIVAAEPKLAAHLATGELNDERE